jgi:hypothetical protein
MVTKEALNMNSYLLCNNCHTEALAEVIPTVYILKLHNIFA